MEKMKVRELMVPVDNFPKISSRASFQEALQALEEAQKEYLEGKNRQRIVLVEDEEDKIVGKISPIDLIRGLERNYDNIEVDKTLNRFGLEYVKKRIQEEYRLWQTPFKDLCRKAVNVKIEDFIKIAGEGQTVNIDDPLARAFDSFVIGRHDSLFVLEGKSIVGLLRFSDVYGKVSETMKECTL